MTNYDEIRQLAEEVTALDIKATPGPWCNTSEGITIDAPDDDVYLGHRQGMPLMYDGDGGDPWDFGTSMVRKPADAELIARYRTIAPQLARDALALSEELERYKAGQRAALAAYREIQNHERTSQAMRDLMGLRLAHHCHEHLVKQPADPDTPPA